MGTASRPTGPGRSRGAAVVLRKHPSVAPAHDHLGIGDVREAAEHRPLPRLRHGAGSVARPPRATCGAGAGVAAWTSAGSSSPSKYTEAAGSRRVLDRGRGEDMRWSGPSSYDGVPPTSSRSTSGQPAWARRSSSSRWSSWRPSLPAAGLRAVDFFAVDRFAAGLRAEVSLCARRCCVQVFFLAVVFLAPDLGAVGLRAVDFFAVDRFAAGLRAEVFFACALPGGWLLWTGHLVGGLHLDRVGGVVGLVDRDILERVSTTAPMMLGAALVASTSCLHPSPAQSLPNLRHGEFLLLPCSSRLTRTAPMQPSCRDCAERRTGTEARSR